MKISSESLSALQEQIRIKDQAAFALGVALAEYEIEKVRVRGDKKMLDTERTYRVGVATSEFDHYRNLHVNIVVRANRQQQEIGDRELQRLGLPESRIFMIDPRSGEVLELVNGAYKPVE